MHRDFDKQYTYNDGSQSQVRFETTTYISSGSMEHIPTQPQKQIGSSSDLILERRFIQSNVNPSLLYTLETTRTRRGIDALSAAASSSTSTSLHVNDTPPCEYTGCTLLTFHEWVRVNGREIKQVYTAMAMQQLKYGILTSWICSYVLERVTRPGDVERLYISRPISSTFDHSITHAAIASSTITTNDGRRLPLYLVSVLMWLQHVVLIDIGSATRVVHPALKSIATTASSSLISTRTLRSSVSTTGSSLGRSDRLRQRSVEPSTTDDRHTSKRRVTTMHASPTVGGRQAMMKKRSSNIFDIIES